MVEENVMHEQLQKGEGERFPHNEFLDKFGIIRAKYPLRPQKIACSYTYETKYTAQFICSACPVH